jgi:hypothetical protein
MMVSVLKGDKYSLSQVDVATRAAGKTNMPTSIARNTARKISDIRGHSEVFAQNVTGIS